MTTTEDSPEIAPGEAVTIAQLQQRLQESQTELQRLRAKQAAPAPETDAEPTTGDDSPEIAPGGPTDEPTPETTQPSTPDEEATPEAAPDEPTEEPAPEAAAEPFAAGFHYCQAGHRCGCDFGAAEPGQLGHGGHVCGWNGWELNADLDHVRQTPPTVAPSEPDEAPI
jgi:hypothetical protein